MASLDRAPLERRHAFDDGGVLRLRQWRRLAERFRYGDSQSITWYVPVVKTTGKMVPNGQDPRKILLPFQL